MGCGEISYSYLSDLIEYETRGNVTGGNARTATVYKTHSGSVCRSDVDCVNSRASRVVVGGGFNPGFLNIGNLLAERPGSEFTRPWNVTVTQTKVQTAQPSNTLSMWVMCLAASRVRF